MILLASARPVLNPTGACNMAYRVLRDRDARFQPRKGLEGPFFYPNGQVLYYDPKEGKYWDPTTDFYVEHEDVAELQNQILSMLVAQNG